MRYLSVCSGIEAATVAWKPLGWEAVGFAEIEPFPNAVLKHHYPEVPNHGDFTTIRSAAVDLVVGGTPCQDFSVAGLRAGLAGDRGRLTVAFVELLDRLRPTWFVWENVPGVLSADEGKAFGAFLGLLGECGFGFAYRVLDAQYFGVPQRRRRVFVVGYLGDWRPAAAVLFERESLCGHTAPSRETGEAASFCVTSRFGSGRNDPTAETYLTHTLRADGFDASEDGTGRGIPLIAPTLSVSNGAGWNKQATDPAALIAFSAGNSEKAGSVAAAEELSPPLRSADSGTNQVPAIAFKIREGLNEPGNTGGKGYLGSEDRAFTVAAAQDQMLFHGSIRRLTPTECERLQGFPDDYTAVPYRGKPAADGPRYRALGNSFAVPVVRWIGRRIDLICRLKGGSP